MGNQKNMMGGFVLILKSAWGVLSTLHFWVWGVWLALKKTCGGFCPPVRKWAWGVLSVGCFVRIPVENSIFGIFRSPAPKLALVAGSR